MAVISSDSIIWEQWVVMYRGWKDWSMMWSGSATVLRTGLHFQTPSRQIKYTTSREITPNVSSVWISTRSEGDLSCSEGKGKKSASFNFTEPLALSVKSVS